MPCPNALPVRKHGMFSVAPGTQTQASVDWVIVRVLLPPMKAMLAQAVPNKRSPRTKGRT